MKSTLKWKQANIIYPTDHLISSKARELGACHGFKPQYENERAHIRFVLSNEYMRLWFKERELYQKENYVKQEKARNEANLKRGYVQRMMVNPKLQTRQLPDFHMKRFQNVISRVDTRRSVEEKTKICERYKKSIEPPELTKYKPQCTVGKQTKQVVQKPKEERNIKKGKNKPQQIGENKQTQPTTGANQCQLVCKLI